MASEKMSTQIFQTFQNKKCPRNTVSEEQQASHAILNFKREIKHFNEILTKFETFNEILTKV